MTELIAVIDGSFDGLLTCVFARYYERLAPDGIVSREMFQQRLGGEYIFIEADPEKARRVFGALKKRAPQAAENVFYAFANPGEGRYMDIFQYIVLAFSKGDDADRYQKLDYVRNVIRMRHFAGMEAHKLHGFVRFAMTRPGVLYSEIGPENDVLYFVALHFTERMMSEAWIIHDVKRKKAAVYNGAELIIAETGGRADVDLAPGEEGLQDLFTGFLTSIAIKERANRKLRQQFIPNRYRPYMTEFSRYSWK